MASNAQLLDLGTLIQIRMDNNYGGLIESLRSAGYNVNPLLPQADTMKLLVNIYNRNPKSAYSILSKVPYNPGANNYTTSDAFKNKVLQITGETAPASTTGKLSWDWLQGIYKPPTTTSVISPTITTTPTGSTATTIGIIAIAAAIVLVAWYMFKS